MPKFPKYQDYVIKDGRLIGEFEQMYVDFVDPWEQTTRELHSIEKIIGINLLQKNRHKRPLEYGCGLGMYTQMLFENFEFAGGVDISETAIQKAIAKYPDPAFFQATYSMSPYFKNLSQTVFALSKSLGMFWKSWPISKIFLKNEQA